MVHDNAKPVRTDSDKFAAFVTRFDDCAIVQIYARPSKYEIDFSREVADYETTSQGATASARKEVKKLEREALLAAIRAKREFVK